MINFNCILNTCGDGYWSNKAKPVQVTGIAVPYINEDEDFGELHVYFDDGFSGSWDVSVDGLIYTDSQFLEELRSKLTEAGLDGSDVDYSEQGMQGDNYVSLDVGADFLKSYKDIAIEEYMSTHEACNG